MFSFGTLLVQVSMSRVPIVELWFNCGSPLVEFGGVCLPVCGLGVYFSLGVQMWVSSGSALGQLVVGGW